MATLCRSPPDSFTPRSPTIVSYCNKSGIDIIFLLEDIKVPHLTFVDLTQQTQDLHTRGQQEFSIPGILDESQLYFFSLDHEK